MKKAEQGERKRLGRRVKSKEQEERQEAIEEGEERSRGEEK